MARIAGVDLPRRKAIAYALPYIYGIGLHTAKVICEKVKIPFDRKVDELSETDVKALRDDRDLQGRGRSPARSAAEHQAFDGPRQLSRSASPQEPPGARAAHPHERPDPQGAEARGGASQMTLSPGDVRRGDVRRGYVRRGYVSEIVEAEIVRSKGFGKWQL